MSFEEKYGKEMTATFKMVTFTTGCVAVGFQLGWAAGVATFCLLPFVLKAIIKSKKENI